ncbi:RHS repeat domain-containing protein [Aquimarina rhabdastrellae]
MKHYSKLWCTLLVCIIGRSYVQSQDSGAVDIAIDYQSEVNQLASGAVSPEASQFIKYGNTPVSLYTGTPEISVPLYTHQGKELSLPMILNYDAQGIKVDQQATWVGLSWNLSVGGSVSRIVNGLSDENLQGGYRTMFNSTVREQVLSYGEENRIFESQEAALAYFQFLEEVNKNDIDIAQDFYSVSAPGLNELLIIDLESLAAKSLKNPRTKVSYERSGHISKWIITSENGTQYHFEAPEYTYVEGSDSASNGAVFQEYVSSWLLTKMISPTGKDLYEFTYSSTGYWTQPVLSAPVSHATNTLPSSPGNGVFESNTRNSASSLTRINQQFLSSVRYNGSTLIQNQLATRLDLPLSTPSRLASSTIYQEVADTNQEPSPLKTIHFNYSYFGIPEAAEPIDYTHEELRLKLDEVRIAAGNSQGAITSNEQDQVYSFSYESPSEVPPKNSLSRDYMGYYNGKGNTVLYPSYLYQGHRYTGADRTVDVTYAKKGMLTKLSYPTKGYTIFNYENHKIRATGSTERKEVTYYANSITGGTDSANTGVCGAYCQDKFQKPPVISQRLFEIKETGVYTFNYKKEGQGAGASEAFMFKHVGSIDNPISVQTIAYDEIIDPLTGTENFNFLWRNNGSQGVTTMELAPGFYQVNLVSSQPSTQLNLRIFREEDVPVAGAVEDKAGLRIQEITDYTTTGAIAMKKEYGYGKAQLLFNPELIYTTEVQKTASTTQDISIETTLHRLSGASSNQPHIVYGEVQVLAHPATGNTVASNGYSIHHFNTVADGIVSQDRRPFFNSFTPDAKAGKERFNSVHSATGAQLATTTTQYENYIYYAKQGYAVTLEENQQAKYVLINKTPTGQYSYEYVNPVWLNTGLGGSSPVTAPGSDLFPTPPSVCDAPDATCLDIAKAPLSLVRTSLLGSIGNPIAIKNTETLAEVTYERTTQMQYAPEVDYLLRSTTTIGIDGQSQTTQQYYAKDKAATEASAASLVAQNRLTTVLVQEGYRNGQKIATRATRYNAFENQELYPSKVQTAKGTYPLEDRIHYLDYDTYGNPIEVKQADGSHSIIVWGYGGRYPLLRISNASYQGMPAAVVDLLSTMQETSTSPSNIAQETQLRAQAQALRSNPYFADSQISSYTYAMSVGITSETDPRGYTTYYEYDAYQRLIMVKDAQGNILSENQYHYKTQE